MTNDVDVRARYADLVEKPEDDLAETLAGLDAVYGHAQPPAGFVARTEALLEARGRRPSLWSRLAGVVREKPLAGVAALLLIVLLLAGTTYAASALIRVLPPEQGPYLHAVPPPMPPPLYVMQYRPLAPQVAARQSGLPVAHLQRVPSPLHRSVATQLFPPSRWEPNVDYHNLSFVRYRGGGETLVVAMYQLSPALVKTHPVLLGERTVHLPNGRNAYASIEPQDPTSTWLLMVLDNYVVALYSNLPLTSVERLAPRVAVVGSAAKPHGIPSSWPAPLPADTPIPGVDVVVMGTIRRGTHGRMNGMTNWVPPPNLTYSFVYGNRGSAPARAIILDVILPHGIAFREPRTVCEDGRCSKVATSHDTLIRVGSGNGDIGGTLPIRITNPQAFARGITVRVSWGGCRHAPCHWPHRSFHFPFS